MRLAVQVSQGLHLPSTLLQVPECQAQVHRTLERASQDVRLSYPLANDCAEDRKRLCPDAQPVREAAAASERPSTVACCTDSALTGGGSSDALRVAAFMCLRVLLTKLLVLPCAQ